MPTMAEYAKSGGYERDKKNSSNFAKTSFPKSSSSSTSSSSSSKSKAAPSGYMSPPMAGGGSSSGVGYMPIPKAVPTPPGAPSSKVGGYWPIPKASVPTPPGDDFKVKISVPGSWPANPDLNVVMPPKRPTPPPRDQAAIEKYADSQIAPKLTAAKGTRDLVTNNLNTQAAQLLKQLTDQRTAQSSRLTASRDQALTGMKTGYEQTQEELRRQRVLQNDAFQRNSNPFSGATDYKSGLMAQEQEITDRHNAQSYNNNVSGVTQDHQNNIAQLEQDISTRTSQIQSNLQIEMANVQKAWQDVENAAPAERARLIKEAQDSERSYELALRNADRDDVLLQLQASKTQMEKARLDNEITNGDWEKKFKLDGREMDEYWKDKTQTWEEEKHADDNAIKVGGLSGLYRNPQIQQIGQQILQLKQAAENANPSDMAAYKQAADQLRNQLATLGVDPNEIGLGFDDDYNSAVQKFPKANYGTPTIAGMELMSKLTGRMPNGEKTNALQQQELENEWTATMNLGKVTPKLSQLTGIPVGTATQDAIKTANSYEYQQGQLKIQGQNADSNASRAEAASNGKQDTAESIAKYIESTPGLFKNESITDENGQARNTGRKVPVDKHQLESMIVSSGLPEREMMKLYQRYFSAFELNQMGFSGN